MIWRRRAAESRERTVTPAQAEDLAEAREALHRVQKATESGRSRWPLILEIKAKLKEIRETNHLREDLEVIFTKRS